MNALTMNTTNLQSVNADLFQRYINYIDAKPKTIETYTKALRQFAYYLRDHFITQPVREDVIAWRDQLKTDHKPSTVQNYITAIRLFFSWTEQEGLYPNIAKHIKGAKLDREHKKDYLAAWQIKEILNGVDRDTLQGKRDYAILVLMTTGGLRTIEVVRANIEDLGTIGNGSVLYIQGKGREERTEYVKLDPNVEKAIRSYLKARGEADPKSPLFTSTSNNNKGSRLTTRTISGLVKGYFKEAGYNSDRLTAHSLRHTAVTLALLGGETIQEAQQFARHSRIETTMIYAHNLEKANNTCTNTIANAIF